MKSNSRQGSRVNWRIASATVLIAFIAGSWIVAYCPTNYGKQAYRSEGAKTLVSNLNEVVSTFSILQSQSIQELNLLCAEGLPGFEGISQSVAENVLQQMADRVRSETQRSRHQ